jgi:cation:H+ antiporter
MLRDLGLLALGGGLLYLGAEWLVRGAAGLAAKLRMKPLVIGLTVVAYGTSAPELVVGIGASLTGRGAIAFGNAVGSNIANIGLILGLTTLISPPKVDGSLRRRELPALVSSALAVPALLYDGRISRIEGVFLMLAAAGYTLAMIRNSRRSTPAAMADAVEVAEDAREAAGAPHAHSARSLVLFSLTGLIGLLLGGRWLVDGASGLALSCGVSERLIGLTIVAIGTSLPELATSVIAARRGHSDLAVGNVVGSNVFNVLLILGASGAVNAYDVSLRESAFEIGGLLLMTLLAAGVLRGARTVHRGEGALLVVLYLLFLVGIALAPR